MAELSATRRSLDRFREAIAPTLDELDSTDRNGSEMADRINSAIDDLARDLGVWREPEVRP